MILSIWNGLKLPKHYSLPTVALLPQPYGRYIQKLLCSTLGVVVVVVVCSTSCSGLDFSMSFLDLYGKEKGFPSPLHVFVYVCALSGHAMS